MKDSAFWRDLRRDFESIPPVDPSRELRSSASLLRTGWWLDDSGPFYARFRDLARRGGALLTGLQEETAIHAWLDTLRDRVKDCFKPYDQVQQQIERRDVPLCLIDVPSIIAHEGLTPADLEMTDSLVVRVIDTGELFGTTTGRYQIVRGGRVYREAQARGLKEVPCAILHISSKAGGGVLHDLREASIRLCEQLENEALIASVTAKEARPTDEAIAAGVATFKQSDARDASQTLTLKQAAEALKVSRDTILRMHAAEKIAMFKIGRQWRVRASEVLRLRGTPKFSAR